MVKKVLIVDDSRTSRKLLRGLLEGLGYEIAGEAENGEKGVLMYKELKPDLVTMDITMPVMDGITALEKIIAEDKSAKVIMISAAGQKSKLLAAVKAGALDFINKPFEEDLIAQSLKKAFK